jgi:hypothetical protein
MREYVEIQVTCDPLAAVQPSGDTFEGGHWTTNIPLAFRQT